LEAKKAGSQVFAEKAAWDFITNSKPNFDLAVINNTYTFGPVPRHLPSLDSLNTSNHRIRDMVQGKMKDGLQPTGPVFTFVDVRDVALAHVRAMELPEAAAKRFYLVGEHFSNKKIAEVIWEEFPELRERLPDVEGCEDDIPKKVYGFDNKRSREMLGIEYRSLETSVVDTVRSILDFKDAVVIG
jgi:nucleoside-diphosphate-sugar epimerase